MSTVHDLRKRIEELSLAISRQYEVLRDLENSKSNAQSQLNTVLDPITRLPLEISSDIFVLCLPALPRPNPNTAPMLFLNICHSWSAIAISTPALWAAIHIVAESPCDDKSILEAWINRARGVPLSLSLVGASDTGLEALVRQNAHQVQDLRLCLRFGGGIININAQFSSLQRLSVGREDGRILQLDLHHCIELMRAAPCLVECDFFGLHFEDESPAGYISSLTHSHLRQLRLGKPSIQKNNSVYILHYLTLPILENLLISWFDIGSEDLFAFFTRSSPSLRRLCLSTPFNWETRTAEAFFHAIPNLTHLDLCFENDSGQRLFDFLESLVNGSLPNLGNLTVRGFSPSQSQCRWLAARLSAWRASQNPRLRSFSLILLFWESDERVGDITTTLGSLEVDTLQIHVGREGKTF
ncbi:hypothetical protein B0H11DRAFT_1794768 [Mycena galericulata]|nr:hypothetical protein B0H11DRAFT_1794768 [Mycena galericulata]